MKLVTQAAFIPFQSARTAGITLLALFSAKSANSMSTLEQRDSTYCTEMPRILQQQKTDILHHG